METLDPKIAKKLEEQALKKFGEKTQPQIKTSAVIPTAPPHTKVLGKFKSVFPFGGKVASHEWLIMLATR